MAGNVGETRAGCTWRRGAPSSEPSTIAATAAVCWYALGWRSPQHEFAGARWRTGAMAVAPVAMGMRRVTAALDVAALQRRLARDKARMVELLTTAQRTELATAAMLAAWADKLQEEPTSEPPAEVLACACAPDTEAYARAPFHRPCRILVTPPVAMKWRRPRWPFGVPRPANMLETYAVERRGDIQGQLDSVRAWCGARLRGQTKQRPAALSWGDDARLPWFRGWVQDFRGDRCEALDERGPAAPEKVHARAFLWYFRDFPNRQLASFVCHGVRMHVDMPLQTTLSPPLFALFDVKGGADAVVDEYHMLESQREWVKGAPLPLTSPARMAPRSATERAGGPPRGLAELGWPRKPHRDHAGDEVVSVNASTGKKAAAAAGDTFYPLNETKPGLREACHNIMIVWVIADMLGLAIILLLFDYKYFFLPPLVGALRAVASRLPTAWKASRRWRGPRGAASALRARHGDGVDASQPHRAEPRGRPYLEARGAGGRGHRAVRDAAAPRQVRVRHALEGTARHSSRRLRHARAYARHAAVHRRQLHLRRRAARGRTLDRVLLPAHRPRLRARRGWCGVSTGYGRAPRAPHARGPPTARARQRPRCARCLGRRRHLVTPDVHRRGNRRGHQLWQPLRHRGRVLSAGERRRLRMRHRERRPSDGS